MGMIESLVGSEGFQASPPYLLCFALRPNEGPGERGTWSAEDDLTSWVWVVSTRRAEPWDNLSLSSSCHSIASGTLGLEVISSTSY